VGDSPNASKTQIDVCFNSTILVFFVMVAAVMVMSMTAVASSSRFALSIDVLQTIALPTSTASLCSD
jgi:hypothetical protein